MFNGFILTWNVDLFVPDMSDFSPSDLGGGGFDFGGGNMPDMSGYGSGSMSGYSSGNSKMTALLAYGACLFFMLMMLLGTSFIKRRR